MNILESFKQFKLEIGDIVYIHYWYNYDIVPVKIIEKRGKSYKISFNVENSSIWNSPDIMVKSTQIIDKFNV